MNLQVAQLETDLGDCRKKLDEAAGVEERLSTEWNAKLEAEKIRRRKVRQMGPPALDVDLSMAGWSPVSHDRLSR